MKLVVVWQTYLKEINRDKYNILQKENNYAVTLLIMKCWHDTLFTAWLEESNILNVEPLPIVANGIEPLYFFSPRKCIKALKRIQPDVIQIDNPTWSLVLLQLIIAKLLVCKKAKIVVFTWLNMPYPKTLKFGLYRVIETFNMFFVDTLICWNNDGKRLFEGRWYEKPIHVLPQLGVDPQFFVKKDVSYIREKLHISAGDFVFWSIGRLVEEKWLADEVAAFQPLTKKYPNIKLLLVGKWPYKEDLERQVQELGISDYVIRVNSVTHEEVVDYINVCDAHILASYEIPTRKEQFGHILIECMSVGVPVIWSDSGEIPFVIGDAWVVFPARNTKKLTDAMEQMLTDTELRKACIEKWKQRVQEHYTHQKIAASLDAVYKSVVA